MNEDDLRLDGNAAAGALTEVFAVEMTAAMGECAHCGATNALGAAQLYVQAPGTVLRCPDCTGVLMMIVRAHERLHVDVSGVRRFEAAAG
jgi:DNA-directed RNA polymerase subunit RPC12/RpoP